MRKRPLPNIKVSPQDQRLLDSFTWYCSPSGYIRRMLPGVNGKVSMEYLHRLIMGSPKGLTVDHINGDKADNRRENLRVCSQKDNSRSRTKMDRRNKSGYRGVHKHRSKWRGMIRVDNHPICLGVYLDPKDAARAYDTAARHYFGEFAKTNF